MSRSPVNIVYTYVQPGCKKVNTAMYVHMGGVSNAYLRIRTAKALVHGEAESWVHGRSKEVPPYYAENNDSST